MSDRTLGVLFVAHDTEKSGAPRILTQIAIRAERLGWRVTVCYPSTGGCEEEARLAGLPTVVIPNPPVSTASASLRHKIPLLWFRVGSIWGTWRLARKPEFDAVWIGSYISALPGLGAKLSGKPVFFHIQEDVQPGTANSLRIRLVKWRARGLAFVARRSVNAFRPRPRGQRWELIPNFPAVRPESDTPELQRLSARGEFRASDAEVVFLTVAFLSRRKGIDVLLEAFRLVSRQHGNARLWIAGGVAPGEEAFAERLKNNVREWGLSDRVRLLGHREDIGRLLQGCDVFVLASRNEALPVTITEAMSAGRPVVATDVGSVSDMVVPGRTGQVVEPENPSRLASAMQAYVATPELTQSHGVAGARRAARLYDPGVIVGKVLAMIREAVE